MNQLTIFDALEESTDVEPVVERISTVKYPDKRYLTEEHFDESVTNPNFVSYLLAAGKKVGDEYRLYEAQIWISQQVSLFKKSHGRSENDMLNQIPEWPEKLKLFLRKDL